MTTNISLYKKTYNEMFVSLFFCIREYIQSTNISDIHESVYHVIQEDV